MLRCLLLFAALASGAFAQSTAHLFGQIDDILTTLSQITGWKVRHPIPAQMLRQETFRGLMEGQMKKSNPKEIRAEELTLKMLGLVPQDFNLASESVDLVSEQAAAFYDYTKKRLFVLDSTEPGPEQDLALAHELAHALADQQYSLGKYLRKDNPDDDAALAREAVMEGQATWLSLAYLAKRAGGKAEVPRAFLETPDLLGASGTDFPVYSNAPLYIRESLVFPYNDGLRFQESLYRRMGRGSFDEVFLHPPKSSQNILHPDTYFAGTGPEMPMPPALDSFAGKSGQAFRVLVDGTLGEFDLSTLLRQYAGDKDGRPAAAHWRGAAYRLYEHKKEGYPVLACTFQWDTPEAAREYFRLYQQVLRGKWNSMAVSSATEDRFTGQGDSGRFDVKVSGTLVQSVEGLR